MTLRSRRTIIAFLFIFFLGLTTFLILYAQGYKIKIDFNNPSLIEASQTGSLSIKTYPEGANIYVDNENFKDTSPTFIPRLEPGEYEIKVVKNGYQTWQKKMIIKPGQITEANNIWLAPQDPETNNLFNDVKVFTANNDKKIGLIDAENNIHIHDISSGKSEEIIDFNSNDTYQNYLKSPNHIQWDPQFKHLLISEQSEHNKYLLVKKDRSSYETERLTQLEGLPLKDVKFHPSKEKIYFLKNNQIMVLELDDLKEDQLLDKTQANGFIINSKAEIIFLNMANGHISLYATKTESLDIVLQTNLEKNDEYNFHHDQKNNKLLIHNLSSGDLYITGEYNLEELTKISENVLDFKINPQGKSLLIVGKNWLEIFYIQDKEDQPLHRAYTKEEVIRFKDKIKAYAWTKSLNNIFVLVNGNVKMIETDDRNTKNCFTIAAYDQEYLGPTISFSYSSRYNSLFFLEQGDLKSINFKKDSFLPF